MNKHSNAYLAAIFIILVVLILVGTMLDYYNVVNGNLLAYYGAIVGGGLTLLGVSWSIKDINETRIKENIKRDYERKEDLSAQYKPILAPYIEQPFLLNGILFCNIRLINQGRGEATNVSITSSTKAKEYISKILGDECCLVGIQQEIKLKDSIIDSYDSQKETMIKIKNELGATFESFITAKYLDIFGNECSLSFGVVYNCSIQLKATDIKDTTNLLNPVNINLDKPPIWTAVMKNIEYAYKIK